LPVCPGVAGVPAAAVPALPVGSIKRETKGAKSMAKAFLSVMTSTTPA